MIDWVGLLPFWAVILAPAAGGLVVGLLLTYALPNRRAEVVADVIEAVLQDVMDWTGDPVLQDDMTLLVARRH